MRQGSQQRCKTLKVSIYGSSESVSLAAHATSMPPSTSSSLPLRPGRSTTREESGLEMSCSLFAALCGKESVVVEGQSYTVRERIGQGGFANIDLVEHSATRQKFALKRIECHSTEDQIAAQREAEFHKHFDHPGILPCEGTSVNGTADIMHNKSSEVFILLPYLPRGTLQGELERRAATKDPLSEERVAELFLQILQAVHHMHTSEPNPMAHRDINPRNILFTQDMRPVIMDLGSMRIARVSVTSHAKAQQLQDEAAQHSMMTYRAPELFQVNSKCEIDERTDVWSLGCLLYAMCFYHSPFDPVYERGDSVALAVQNERLEIPTDSPYSTDLHNAILWMLTPDPRMRPHVAQLINRFQDIKKSPNVTPRTAGSKPDARESPNVVA